MHCVLMQHSTVSLGTYLLAVVIVFSLGFGYAVATRANKDYKAVKAAVAPARKAFWVSVWLTIKAGFWVLVVFLVLITWQIRDVRDGDDHTPILPAKGASTRPTR